MNYLRKVKPMKSSTSHPLPIPIQESRFTPNGACMTYALGGASGSHDLIFRRQSSCSFIMPISSALRTLVLSTSGDGSKRTLGGSVTKSKSQPYSGGLRVYHKNSKPLSCFVASPARHVAYCALSKSITMAGTTAKRLIDVQRFAHIMISTMARFLHATCRTPVLSTSTDLTFSQSRP
jgi:hypothetical protein